MSLRRIKFFYKTVLFLLCTLFCLSCGTGPAVLSDDQTANTDPQTTSSADFARYFSFGGWRGTSTSEHYALQAIDYNPIIFSNMSGNNFSLAPESGVSSDFYLQQGVSK